MAAPLAAKGRPLTAVQTMFCVHGEELVLELMTTQDCNKARNQAELSSSGFSCCCTASHKPGTPEGAELLPVMPSAWRERSPDWTAALKVASAWSSSRW